MKSYNNENSPLMQKSFTFAVEIVHLSRRLISEIKEYNLANQIMRSGTSIGANIEEAHGAVSGADFKNKMSIAYKEARETSYWLRVLHASSLLDKSTFERMFSSCEEISKMLRATINTMNNKKANSLKLAAKS
jgi:four helix bundle protein